MREKAEKDAAAKGERTGVAHDVRGAQESHLSHKARGGHAVPHAAVNRQPREQPAHAEADEEIAGASDQDAGGRLQIDMTQAMKNEQGAEGGQEAEQLLDR